ncbi:hypothetical protein HMPREF0576_1728 [Mobiluncus holmesii ATCC 35242]|uniref:Uncharacterized protein n=1 Tax=Mobiluncus holmesii ATCC 35242 TaxID=887899 RepID=E6M646_9ACTO|nr:hypothetical protein HMPREF0576_1728 [Mobiluncus holmesii ATCC 35242]
MTKSRALARLLVNLGATTGIEQVRSVAATQSREPLSKTVEALKNGTGVPF